MHPHDGRLGRRRESERRHPTVHRSAQLVTLSAGIAVVAGGGVAAALADNAHELRAGVSTSAEAAAGAGVSHRGHR